MNLPSWVVRKVSTSPVANRMLNRSSEFVLVMTGDVTGHVGMWIISTWPELFTGPTMLMGCLTLNFCRFPGNHFLSAKMKRTANRVVLSG